MWGQLKWCVGWGGWLQLAGMSWLFAEVSYFLYTNEATPAACVKQKVNSHSSLSRCFPSSSCSTRGRKRLHFVGWTSLFTPLFILSVRVRVSQLLPGVWLKAECSSLTFLFKGEVLRQVPALVVPTQEEECGGVVDLQWPEVENTLQEERWCVEA